jgi:hypothetical protein
MFFMALELYGFSPVTDKFLQHDSQSPATYIITFCKRLVFTLMQFAKTGYTKRQMDGVRLAASRLKCKYYIASVWLVNGHMCEY